MTPHDPLKYLKDVQEQCFWIQRQVRGKTLADYLEDGLLRPALERKLEIIGEALNQLFKVEPALEPKIGDAKRVIAFRNRLVHGYADLNPVIVWSAATDKVPELLRDVEKLLEERGA